MTKEKQTIELVLGEGQDIKLVVPQYYNITRSFSQKVALDNYGIDGEKYSPRDFFSSHGDQIPVEEATPELIAETSEALYQRAKIEVETAVHNYIEQAKQPKNDGMTSEELTQIAPFIQMIVNKEDAVDKIKEAGLNDQQLEFLRNLLRSQQDGQA